MSSFEFVQRRILAKLNNDIELLEIDLDEYIATAHGISKKEKEAWVAVQEAQIALRKVKREEMFTRLPNWSRTLPQS